MHVPWRSPFAPDSRARGIARRGGGAKGSDQLCMPVLSLTAKAELWRALRPRRRLRLHPAREGMARLEPFPERLGIAEHRGGHAAILRVDEARRALERL